MSVRSFWEHEYSDRCPVFQGKWCKIHWVRIWDEGESFNAKLPQPFNILTSTYGWQERWVHCGPSAFFPSRAHWMRAKS